MATHSHSAQLTFPEFRATYAQRKPETTILLARNPKIKTLTLNIVHRAIDRHIKNKAKWKGLRAPLQTGAVTLIQRFGGSINLNTHFHMLVLEGGYYATQAGPRYWWVDSPTDDEIKRLVEQIAKRVMRALKRRGYFAGDSEWSAPDEESLQNELLPEVQAASIRSRIAMGERKGQRVRRIGTTSFSDTNAELVGPLCAQINGFSLHAGVYCSPWQRSKLESLCRYVARPAVAEERLAELPNGNIVYQMKKAYSDGTTHLMFSPIEFLEKLAALVPQPRIHLTRFHGVLAPNCKIRKQVVPQKESPCRAGLVSRFPKAPKEAATQRCDLDRKPRRRKTGVRTHGPGLGWGNFRFWALKGSLLPVALRKMVSIIPIPSPHSPSSFNPFLHGKIQTPSIF